MGLKERLRRTPVIGFGIAVQERFGGDRAGYLATVVAYYGFLSLFPLLLLALSVVGFVLAGRPDVQRDVAATVSGAVPGLQPVLGASLQALVDARVAAGVVGLAGLLWAGVRAAEVAGFAVSRVFRVRPYAGFLKRKAWAIAVTTGLGLLALVSLAVVAVVGNVRLDGPAGALVPIAGVLVGVALDVLLFLVGYRVLTHRTGPRFGRLWKGALAAGVGWTGLKVVGTWYVARTVAGATAVYGTLAGAVGILLLLHLASRLLLYGAEINAVALEREGGRPGPADDPLVPRDGESRMKGGGRMAGTGGGDRSTGELVRSIAGDTAELVRKQVELARQEIVEGVMGKVMGAGAFAGAGVFGLIAFVFLGVTAGVALSIVLPAWLAWLITSGAFLLVAGVAALIGRRLIARRSVAPEETKRTVKEDVEWARDQLKR